MADERTPEIELAIDGKVCLTLNLLGEDLSENHLLGEVLGPDDDSIRIRTGRQRHNQTGQAQQFRKSFLKRAETKVCDQCECGRRNGAPEYEAATDHGP